MFFPVHNATAKAVPQTIPVAIAKKTARNEPMFGVNETRNAKNIPAKKTTGVRIATLIKLSK